MSNLLRYDEPALVADLAKLSVRARAAFAAACAERLFPAYRRFCEQSGRGDVSVLTQIRDRIWEAVTTQKLDPDVVTADLAQCMTLIPSEEDEPWVEEQPYAEDAASAIAYTLRTMESGEPQEAGWAARRTYEALDHYVIHRLDIEGEEEIMAHPLVQAELERQRRDVERLRGESDIERTIADLRSLARSEAAAFFGSIAAGRD